MCKKQASVSHSSTEAKIFSLDAGLRMDGIPALDLWDLVIEIFHSVTNKIEHSKEELQPVAGHQAKHAQPHPSQAHQRHSNKHWSHSSEHNTMHFEWGGNQNDDPK